MLCNIIERMNTEIKQKLGVLCYGLLPLKPRASFCRAAAAVWAAYEREFSGAPPFPVLAFPTLTICKSERLKGGGVYDLLFVVCCGD